MVLGIDPNTNFVYSLSTTSEHVVLFLIGMSLRGFSSLHCSFVFIYKAGECSSWWRMYISIGVHLRKVILGGNNRLRHNCNNNHNNGALKTDDYTV